VEKIKTIHYCAVDIAKETAIPIARYGWFQILSEREFQMEKDKTCTKCPNSPKMIKLDRKSITPDLTELMEINTKSGIYLQAVECPHCRLVEFYRIDR